MASEGMVFEPCSWSARRAPYMCPWVGRKLWSALYTPQGGVQSPRTMKLVLSVHLLEVLVPLLRT